MMRLGRIKKNNSGGYSTSFEEKKEENQEEKRKKPAINTVIATTPCRAQLSEGAEGGEQGALFGSPQSESRIRVAPPRT